MKKSNIFHTPLIVVHIEEQADPAYAEVIFLQSTRYYRLLKTHPDYAGLMRSLKSSLEQKRPLKVECDQVNDDVIVGLEWNSP
jgi:hypothetical protein